MALDDQEKTVFASPTGNYDYKEMPFGLKNAEFTYQSMMTRMFESQLGKNIEVYIDDMVKFEHASDLRSIFEVLRKHKLRLNASKCSFGVSSGNFWVIWSLIVKLNSTLIKLRQLTIYNLLGVPRKSRN